MFKSVATIAAGLSASAIFGFAAAGADAVARTPAPAQDLAEHDWGLFVDYLVCSETAAIRVMSQSEAASCILLYTEVKLTFVPEVDLVAFLRMPPLERHRVNLQGYAAYVEWRAANPARFEELSAMARVRVAQDGS
jgi:hypothetical protein